MPYNPLSMSDGRERETKPAATWRGSVAAMMEATEERPAGPQHTRAELLRRSFPLFAMELACRAHTLTHTHTHRHALLCWHAHTRTRGHTQPFSPFCSQAVPPFWWISQANSLARGGHWGWLF
jgi:hypothetical protein